MTTYNAYQEAKIANPEYAVFEYQGNFGTDKEILDMLDVQSREIKECNPADYCMTVEKFLADGYKFELGDICLDDEGYVINIDVKGHTWNEPDRFDVDRYVLKAAALEEKPKPTKFVKVEEPIFDLRGEFERGELYSSDCEGHYTQLKCEKKLYLAAHQYSVYRQVEIDWRDEVVDLFDSRLIARRGNWFLIGGVYVLSSTLVKLSHRIASLTEKPTN